MTQKVGYKLVSDVRECFNLDEHINNWIRCLFFFCYDHKICPNSTSCMRHEISFHISPTLLYILIKSKAEGENKQM